MDVPGRPASVPARSAAETTGGVAELLAHARVLSIALLCAVPPTASAQNAAPAARPPLKATLADVAFMTGHWAGGEAGDLSEEVWSAAEGDSMIGMWRFVGKGRARIFEVLTLTAEGDNVILRIRHFNPKLVAREEKDRPVELPLVAKTVNEAVFEGPELGGAGAVRLTYRRPTPETLVSILEKDGKPQEFRFRKR